jgi:hypothetical protein
VIFSDCFINTLLFLFVKMVFWEDVAVTFASFLIMVALSIQVVHGFRVKKREIGFHTSIPAFFGLLILTVSYWSLGLVFASVAGVVKTLLWLLIIVQDVMYK